MYTYLTTYPSSVSIYPASNDAGGNIFQLTLSAKYSTGGYNYGITSYAVAEIYKNVTQSNGYQNFKLENANAVVADGPYPYDNYELENANQLNWSMSTYSNLPFSIYQGKIEKTYYISGDNGENGETTKQTFTISHYGSYTSGSAIGGTTYSEDGESTTGEYSTPPDFFSDTIIYSAPIYTTLQDTIRIRSTTTTNKTYVFLSSVYSTQDTIETSSFTEITYQSTISTTTNIHHHIGTSIDNNNSCFTVITDTNSDGFAISPYACLLSAPRTNIIFPQEISTFSKTILIPEDPEFRAIKYENFGNSLPVFHTIHDAIQELSTTYKNEGSYILNDVSTSSRILNYLYNGYTGSFSTTETNYTARSTQSESVGVYSYANGTNTYNIYSTSRNILTSTITTTEIRGVLASQGQLRVSSIFFTTMQKTTLQYKTSTQSVEANAQFSYTTVVVDIYETDNLLFTSSYSQTIYRSGGGETLAEFNSTKPFIDSIIPPTESVYVPTIINDEHWAGVGNIYNFALTEYNKTFAEQPNIFYFKNRITYNASNLLKNNGIFSILNKNAYNDYEFPAFGQGGSFSTTTEKIFNTSETTTTIFKRKMLVGPAKIYDPYINTFVLPERSIVSDSSFTDYTKYAVAYSNAIITRIAPNGSSETIPRHISVTAEYLAGYNTIPYLIPGTYFNFDIFASPIKSLKQHPDYLTIEASKEFIGLSDDNFIISLHKSYYVTEINTNDNSSSTYITSYEGTTFSTSNFLNLRYIVPFCKKEDTGINYIGGYYQGTIEGDTNSDATTYKTSRFWDTGQSLSNTIFNFTSYIGSTYIDV